MSRALGGPDKVAAAKHTTFFYNFAERISFAENGKLVAESSEFHLMLNRAHRAPFSQLEIRKKSGTFLSGKWESGMALKKLEFMPESGNVDTYDPEFIQLDMVCSASYLRRIIVVDALASCSSG